MLGHAVARQPALMLAMRPIGLRLRHWVDALGSAIGESIASPSAIKTLPAEGDGLRRSDAIQRIQIDKMPEAPVVYIDRDLPPAPTPVDNRSLLNAADAELRGKPGPAEPAHLPRVVVSGQSRATLAGDQMAPLAELRAQIADASSPEDARRLAGQFVDSAKRLYASAAQAEAGGSKDVAKTYRRAAGNYIVASGQADREAGRFTPASSIPRYFTNPEPWGGDVNWNAYGANAAGVSTSFRQGTPEGVDRLVPLLVTAPFTVPLLTTTWGLGGAVLFGGGTATYQYFSSGNVNAYDVLDAGSFGAALPSLATSAYSLTTRAWSRTPTGQR